MTRILIIRHGEADQVGLRLLGRTPGVHLTARGRAQARSLATYLRECNVAALFTSPIERAAETASEIAAELDMTPTVLPGIIELEFGGWTGRSFEELNSLEEWMRFNFARTDACPPGGESMRQVQARAVTALSQSADAYSGKIIIAVTHADVIRAVLAAWLPMSLDKVWHIEIDLASITAIELGDSWQRILFVNGLAGERNLGLLSSIEEPTNTIERRKS